MTDTITVRGFAGTSPDHRTPASGTEVTTLRLGSTPRWRNSQTGEWSSGSTNWYTVAAFGRLAENVAGSISKGDPIVVVGRPKVRQWENDDGIKGTDVEISAQSVAHDLTYGRSLFTKVSLAPRSDDQQEASQHGEQPGSAAHSQQTSASADAAPGHAEEAAGPIDPDQQDGPEQQNDADPTEGAAPESAPIHGHQPAAESQAPWSGDPALQRTG